MRLFSVLGGGSFGTALADLLAKRGAEVRFWVRNPTVVDAIQRTRRNPDHQSDRELPRTVSATADLSAALESTEAVFLTVPSHAVRSVLTVAKPHLAATPIVLAAKGIENETLMTMEEVSTDVLGRETRPRLLTLSGPSFAREIMLGHPTAVVLAGADERLAQRISDVLFCDTFRAYTSTDVVGVEMGGALKNVMAIAAGVVTGLGFGDNTLAALVTRGLAEITRLAVAKGAHPMTLAGLAGLGDLVLTCTGQLSRNRAFGEALGRGATVEEALRSFKEVVEGVRTARSAYLLAQKLGVDVGITTVVYRGLYEGLPVREAVTALVRRPPGSELEH